MELKWFTATLVLYYLELLFRDCLRCHSKDTQNQCFKLWDSLILHTCLPTLYILISLQLNFHVNFIPYLAFRKKLIRGQVHIFVSGETGVGKTAIIQNVLNKLAEGDEFTNMILTYQSP